MTFYGTSNVICIFTAPSIAPQNFRSISITATSVIFQWDSLTISEANGIVRGFTIACSDSESALVMVSLPVTTRI